MPQPKLKPPVPCLRCPLPASSRGLCNRCYSLLANRIRRGVFPGGWRHAEAIGECLPAQKQPAEEQPPATIPAEEYESRWDLSTDLMTEEELDALIASRRPTMPGWHPGEE